MVVNFVISTLWLPYFQRMWLYSNVFCFRLTWQTSNDASTDTVLRNRYGTKMLSYHWCYQVVGPLLFRSVYSKIPNMLKPKLLLALLSLLPLCFGIDLCLFLGTCQIQIGKCFNLLSPIYYSSVNDDINNQQYASAFNLVINCCYWIL